MRTTETRRISGDIRRLGVFTGHMLMGTAMFIVVLLCAALTGLAADQLAPLIGDHFSIVVLEWVSRILIVLDGVLLVWHSAQAVRRAFKP